MGSASLRARVDRRSVGGLDAVEGMMQEKLPVYIANNIQIGLEASWLACGLSNKGYRQTSQVAIVRGAYSVTM